jgi:hypothetical protein
MPPNRSDPLTVERLPDTLPALNRVAVEEEALSTCRPACLALAWCASLGARTHPPAPAGRPLAARPGPAARRPWLPTKRAAPVQRDTPQVDKAIAPPGLVV